MTADGPVLAADHRSGSVALRRGASKLMRNGTKRKLLPLPAIAEFDLTTDPAERWNRIRSDAPPPISQALDRIRAESQALHDHISQGAPSSTVGISEEEREQLRALGYAEGS